MRGREGFRQVLDLIKEVGIARWIKRANKKRRDYPEMPVDLRRELDEHYAPTIQRIEQILGRRLKVWRNRSQLDSFADHAVSSCSR